MKPRIISKTDVYSEFPDRVQELEAIAVTDRKKKLKHKTREIIFTVEHADEVFFIIGTSYGYGDNKSCEVYVDVHSNLEFLKELPEFDMVSLSGHYYIFNIHKKFLLRAK